MNKIDEIAAAIYDKWEARPKYAKLQMNGLIARELAIAAIKAMREPTTDMEVFGTEAWACEAAMEDRAAANYRAMIDFVLLDSLKVINHEPLPPEHLARLTTMAKERGWRSE